MSAFDSLLSVKPAAGQEQDFRLQILDALLRTPHRDVEPYFALFKHVHDNDPRFFGQLAVWYFANGSGRDLKDLFVAFLCVSNFDSSFREAGVTMLQALPPFQVERVLRIIKGSKKQKGVANEVPRSFKTAVKQYLRSREANVKQFDGAALRARGSLKSLYSSLHIKPNDYAQAVLFSSTPPAGSVFAVLKQISAATDPTEQARLLVENRIPYTTAVSIIKSVTPAVLVALVNAMTPQELLNNLNSLKQRGVMENPELRRMVEAKLEQAKTNKNVSALKTRVAAEVSDLDDDLTQLVKSVGDAQIKNKGQITKRTALLVDKSGSLAVAINVGKQLAALVAPVCQSDLTVYAFDNMTYPIRPKGVEMSDWEAAFKGINASGYTSCGAPVERLRKEKITVDQIIMVTDQDENCAPMLLPALQAYEKDMGFVPNVIFLNVGTYSNKLVNQLKANGVEADVYTFTGDYYSLPSILPMLSGGSRLDLLNDIMNLQLPQRTKAKEMVKSSA